nr:hypothetical protein [uncultured Olsenella sp.]
MADIFSPALPGIVSGLTLAVVTALSTFVARELSGFRHNYRILLEAQRNQLKSSIVETFERSQRRGHITAMELETLNRRAESYFDLGGNNYIHALVEQANDMQIRGSIPRRERSGK